MHQTTELQNMRSKTTTNKPDKNERINKLMIKWQTSTVLSEIERITRKKISKDI